MRPEIAALVRPTYPKLQDHPKVLKYPNVMGLADNVSHKSLSTYMSVLKHPRSADVHFQTNIDLCIVSVYAGAYTFSWFAEHQTS
jgi:hypothetical protein